MSEFIEIYPEIECHLLLLDREVDLALREAGLAPLTLGPKEGLALLNGTQFSCSYALAGLFEAEALFRAALVTGALSTEAAQGSDTPIDPRIPALRGPNGQIQPARSVVRRVGNEGVGHCHSRGS